MLVTATKPILYGGKKMARVYEKGETFEMDDVSAYVRIKRGDVVGEKAVEKADKLNDALTEGLPALDETPTRKKK